MRYTLVEYDVRAEKHLSVVRDWRRWADGQVPALELDGNGKVRQYVGSKISASLRSSARNG